MKYQIMQNHGYESKHNSDCWNQEEYLGFGLAAHSYIDDTRYSNIEDLEEYLKNINNKEFGNNIIIHERQNKEEKRKGIYATWLKKD